MRTFSIKPILGVALGMLLVSHSAFAALGGTRKAHFNASGYNRTVTTLLAENHNSTCLITVTNVSSTAQTMTLYATAKEGIDGGAEAAFLTSSWMPTSVVNASPVATVQTAVSLTAGETKVYYIDYPVIPLGVVRHQSISCSGYVIVQDTDSAQPGFIMATGTLSTFEESGKAQDKSGSGTLKGSVTINQVPISVGEGRPF